MDRQYEIPTDILSISRDDLREFFSEGEIALFTDADMELLAEQLGVAINESLRDELEFFAGRLIREKTT